MRRLAALNRDSQCRSALIARIGASSRRIAPLGRTSCLELADRLPARLDARQPRPVCYLYRYIIESHVPSADISQ